MRIVVIGAGPVGMTAVDALHREHDVVVVDLVAAKLQAASYEYDVRTVEGNGATRATLIDAGVEQADLVIASTARAEVNLVAGMLVRRLSTAKTIVRTSGTDYLSSWLDGQLDVDYMVSAEVETAREVAAAITVPAACATEMFADGLVQLVELDVPTRETAPTIVGRPLREAQLPDESTVACILRDGATLVPRGSEQLEPGDRVIVIASPDGARAWSAALWPDAPRIEDAVIFGGGRVGRAIAAELLDRGLAVRIVERNEAQARQAAALLPRGRVLHASGRDREFLRRERIGETGVAVTATADDAENLFLAVLARSLGAGLTIGLVDDPTSARVFEHGGVDVTMNPRLETAEEMVRFAHDPRTRQVALLDDDRLVVLDVELRPDSELIGVPFAALPREPGQTIGAIVRDGEAIFAHRDTVLRPGDRAIVLAAGDRATAVERAL